LLTSVAVTEVTGAGVGDGAGTLVGAGTGAGVGTTTGELVDTHVAVSVMVPLTHRVMPDTSYPVSQPGMHALPE